MIHHRGYCHDVEALHLKVVALCAVFWLTAFGPCTMTGSENLMGYDEHESYKTDFGLVPEDVLVRVQTSVSKLNLDNICRRSELFCFPSTLSGFFSDFHITEANVSGNTVVVGSMQPTDDLWSSNRANFRLLNGDFVSCSLESTISASEENDTSSVGIESNQLSDFLSRDVRISHPVLDWGQKYLHFPSLAYLTVENRHKSSVLNVFEPYSTDKQFYPCNYSEFKIGPGDTASLCFVFLPKWLGLSSAHLILQTSSGGFLVRAQGFAVQPPYMLQSSLGSSPWVISISNPSKTVLHLKEVSAWMSFSSRNLSYTVNGVCSRIDHPVSFETSVTEWLDVKIGQQGMAIQLQKTWTVGSNSSEPILVIEFPYHSQRNVYGSFCMQLLNNASIDNLDTVIFEAEFGGKPGSYELETDSLISLNVLTPCDANGTISVSVLVENDGPTLLNVVKIRTVGENTESLQTKYVGGLILFPRTVTQVAMVTYTPRLHANLNCKLIVSTNKSNSPDFEVACSNIAGLCSHSHHVHLPLELKATETVEADESILANWRSHRTENGRSVLDDHEVIFPVVRIGAHHSKWIKVKNPSDQPVVMQLLLNSGEIINECREDRESDESFQTYSSYNLVLGSQKTPLWHGFSVPYNALTEAYVHPHGKTVLGPIVFHPSSQCAWKSSALVRNNLSGVEWLSLRGSGGLVSLTLHDGSGPLRSIELKHDYGHPFMKVLFAKNTGDLPLKVNEVTVSGTRCELDGFVVGNCKGFALQPGESQKVIVSYRAGICADTVLRDLEFVTTGGILVVPVKIALPKPILVICKRSVFCMRFKKFLISVSVLVSVVIFVATSCMFTVITKGGNQFKTHSSDVYLEPDASNKVVTSSPLPPPPPLPSSPQLSSPKPLPPPKPPLSSSPSPPQSPPLPSPPRPSSLRPSPPPSPLKLKSMEIESPKPENLTIQTGKNKARRKKKKRSSGTGLTGHVDGSSSHSSSSTPSSPSSVVKCSTPTTPKRSPELSPNRPVQARSPFNHRGFNTVLPVKEKASPPKITSPFARAPEPVKRKESSDNDNAGHWCNRNFLLARPS